MSDAASHSDDSGAERRPAQSLEEWQRKKRRLAAEQEAAGAAAAEAEEVAFVPLAKRRRGAAQAHHADTTTHDSQEQNLLGPQSKVSLLEVARAQPKLSEEEQKQQEEAEILSHLHAAPALVPVKARAASEPIETPPVKSIWHAPRCFEALSEAQRQKLRKKMGIIAETQPHAEQVPPPICAFQAMKFPNCILEALKNKGIQKPTPIQIQALPVILSGRDLIGIAHTGSGKTLVFTLPLIMRCLCEEMKLPLSANEGPIGIILCPSRELAKQTFDIIEYFCSYIAKDEQFRGIELRTVLLTGGVDMREQTEPFRRNGVHMVVSTPGRLIHMLKSKRINMNMCQYMCMDEADRMIDVGFEEDTRQILDFFDPKRPRQTVLFSATMPTKIRQFATSALRSDFCVVNVGRAGAASLNVVQEVEFVRQESKLPYLLEALQKTAPPVLIFCKNKSDVEDIHEYLLLKGVAAVSIHGGKDQQERMDAIAQFQAGKKDVLVATDVVSKGLDFSNIQHVINFDMPDDIETYVHRIGRTGRGGKTGTATTFINTEDNEQVLLDLKHLLMEAKQVVPPVLKKLQDPYEEALAAAGKPGDEGKECPYCGGLGHALERCPKYLREKEEKIREHKRRAQQMGGDY